MRTPSFRTARLAAWLAVPAALLASGLVISQASYSAFSEKTVNPTNNWTTGTVHLSDNDSNSALFTATALKPGSTETKCIAVTSTGSLPSIIKLYTTPSSLATTNELSKWIDLTVTAGTSTATATTDFPACTGFTALASNSAVYSGTVADFGTNATGFSSGQGTWTTAGGTETHVYKFTYSVNTLAPNTTQDSTASVGFTWEAQNTAN